MTYLELSFFVNPTRMVCQEGIDDDNYVGIFKPVSMRNFLDFNCNFSIERSAAMRT